MRYIRVVTYLLVFYICFPSMSQEAGPWYKNNIFYSLEVATFKDSNGDGIGDFNGVIQKLGYLDTLGIDVIWLSPITPSPGKDDGYDVTDYYKVNPKFGTEQDFNNLIKAAHQRNIKVIIDIVLNHVSDEHPWFKEARRDTASKYHRWFVWADRRPADADKGMVFPGVQNETWTYDSLAHKYYFHRFYNFQPDLNYANTEVQKEAFRILKFWVAKGVDGYRLDAVPFIIDLPETGSEKPDRMLWLVPAMRNAVKEMNQETLLLGEANLSPAENKDYFGENNNGIQMMFNFYANQFLFYGLATGRLKPLIKAIKDTRKKPDAAQWAYFLRNHDEIDLARLPEAHRNKVYEKFGPDASMQLYDRGIRRRLAPMLSNIQQLKMAYSLLYALPGAPVIRYGEEIGMGDDLSLKERLSVRTPMQWSGDANGGFSSSKHTFRKVIEDPVYGYKTLNVAAQLADSNSLLQHITRLMHIRKSCVEIGSGNFSILKTNNKALLVIKYEYNNHTLITVHNFSPARQQFKIKDLPEGTNMHNLLSTGDLRRNTVQSIEGYGYAWFRTGAL